MADGSPPDPSGANPPALDVRGLSKTFGALVATRDLDVQIATHECHALIGPNGAGKTTLVAQIAGELAPDRGTIAFHGRDIGRLAPDARARLGIARSFQITASIDEYTVAQNVALAVLGRDALRMRFWRSAFRDARLFDPARAALERVGLGDRAHVRAADLAHGEARLLDLAIALASNASLLLLDEPMAGLGHDESHAMIALLATLKGSVTMLLIEHDMDAVARLADRVTVLVEGRAIACGSYDAIRLDPAVRDAYLGVEA